MDGSNPKQDCSEISPILLNEVHSQETAFRIALIISSPVPLEKLSCIVNSNVKYDWLVKSGFMKLGYQFASISTAFIVFALTRLVSIQGVCKGDSRDQARTKSECEI